MALVTNLDTAPVNQAVNGGQRSVESVASFLRPANATPYAAGDVISDSASVAAVLEFPLCAARPGSGGRILRAHIAHDVNIATPPDLELYLFHAAPADHLDNAAMALADADLPKMHAVYDFTGSAAKVVNATASPAGALYWLTANAANTHSFVCEEGTRSLYGLLVTRSVFTPVTGSKWITALEMLQD